MTQNARPPCSCPLAAPSLVSGPAIPRARILELALAAAQRAGDQPSEVRTQIQLAIVLHDQLNRARDGLTHLQRALPVARALHDHASETTLLNNSAFFFDGLGETDSAVAYYRMAIRGRQSGDAFNAYENLASVFDRAGQPDSGWRPSGWRPPRHGVNHGAATSSAFCSIWGERFGGDDRFGRTAAVTDSALASFTRAASLADARDDSAGVVTALEALGQALTTLQRSKDAIRELDRARVMLLAKGDVRGAAREDGLIADAFAQLRQIDSVRWYQDERRRPIAHSTTVSASPVRCA